jgi:peptide/nickel transport system substrate-binding protein
MIRGWRRVLLASCISVLALTGCASGNTNTTGGARVNGGELVIGFPNNEAADAKSLDPNIGGGATYVNSIYGAMYDQLVYQDPQSGKVVPGLAQSWDVSPDGTQYTFHLTPKAQWWDGTPVTADDVKYTLDRTVDKQYLPGNAYTSALMARYDHSEVIDSHTIKVFLKSPQTNFLPSVVGRTYLDIVPKAYIEKVGIQVFGQQKPMGSGPYEFVEWVHGDHITLKRNPKYTWGPSFFQTSGGPPSVDKLVFHFILDDNTRLSALRSGQLNAIIGIAPFEQSSIQSGGQFQVIQVHKNGQPGGLNFNTQKFPTNDLAVRQAFSYAIDRDALNKAVYAGTEFPAYHILEDRMGQWVDQNAAFPQVDIAKAKQLLDADGWVPGADGIRVKNGQRLVVKSISGPDMQQAMTLIQSEVKAVGIEFDVNTLAAAQVSSTVQGAGGDFNAVWAIRAGWTNEDPYLLYSLFDSRNIPPNGTSNYSRVNLPDVDQLLETASITADPTQRQNLYFQAEEKLVAYVPFLPLLSFNQNIATVKGVNGLMPDRRGTYTYFDDVWIDKSIQSKWNG